MRKINRWTEDEKKRLDEYYPKEGKHCEDRFPGRTRAAIVAMAAKRGLKYEEPAAEIEEQPEETSIEEEVITEYTSVEIVEIEESAKIEEQHDHTTIEEEVIAEDTSAELDMKIDQMDMYRAICTHKDPTNGSSTLIQNNDGSYTCSICGETFNFLKNIYDDHDVALYAEKFGINKSDIKDIKKRIRSNMIEESSNNIHAIDEYIHHTDDVKKLKMLYNIIKYIATTID